MRVFYVVSVDLYKSTIDYIVTGRKLLFKTLSVIMADNYDIQNISISYSTTIPEGAEQISNGIWEMKRGC